MSTIPIIRNEEERALLTKLAAHLKGRTLRTHGDDGPFGPNIPPNEISQEYSSWSTN